MEMPTNFKPTLLGAIGGAAVLAIVGFSWGGWVTASTAEMQAKQKASSAVVAVLAPICADNFKRGKDASAQLIELKKASTWERGTFVEKGGWATIPGVAAVDTEMARACAALITTDKS